MPEPQEIEQDSRDLMVAALLAAVVGVLVWYLTSGFHPWGDDFAGYVLQARAIDRGELRAELELNGSLMILSDDSVGPPAYPWGFPAMLWVASRFAGWELGDLKIVGILADAIVAACVYLVARSYLGRAGSVVAALGVALQPLVVVSADSLESDLPCLAVSGVALVFTQRFARTPSNGTGVRPWLMLVASLLVVTAFSIRSNGAFLAVALFVALGGDWLAARPSQRRAIATDLLLLTFATTVLLVGYLWALPDGSLVQARYMTEAPDDMRHRLGDVFTSAMEFIPLSWLRRLDVGHGAVTGVACAFVVALACIGAWRYRDRSAGLVTFALLNVGLLLLFPNKGIARYAFPIVLPVVVLGVAGLGVTFNALTASSRLERVRSHAPVVRLSALGLALLALGVSLVNAKRAVPPGIVSGPQTPASDSLFAYVRSQVPDLAHVSFFKPRALRLFTGRQGIAITHAGNLARADFVIVNKRAEDGRWQRVWQVDQQAIEAFGNGRFSRRYENGQFVVYGVSPAGGK